MRYSGRYSPLSKAAPIVEIIDLVITQEEIMFDLDIIDIDLVGSLTSIELYKGETLIESLTDLTVREFTGLLSNTEYIIKARYTYDLNGGVGEETEEATSIVSTLVKATPTIEVINVVATQEAISFELDITDIDTVGTLTSIELYQGETLIESLTDLTVREFTGLLSNNEYTIKAIYTYNLNDGVGEQTEQAVYTENTLVKATPTIEVTNVVPQQESITFELDITDTDTDVHTDTGTDTDAHH